MRFYIPGSLEAGQHYPLSESDSKHFTQVLRGALGENIELFNGEGMVAQAEVTNVAKRAVIATVRTATQHEPSSKISLVFGLCKGGALDFIFHRCTEVGLASFQPIITDHSSRASIWNPDRWSRVVTEVAKQCQAVWLPAVHEPIALSEWLAKRDTSRTLIFCDENKREGKAPTAGLALDLLVGAEGGWSQGERETILKLGAQNLGLGSQRLRAETAALIGLTLLKASSGEI